MLALRDSPRIEGRLIDVFGETKRIFVELIESESELMIQLGRRLILALVVWMRLTKESRRSNHPKLILEGCLEGRRSRLLGGRSEGRSADKEGCENSGLHGWHVRYR
jgi:hypothetical protein